MLVDNIKEPLQQLFHGGTRLEYKKGEFIIRPGEKPMGVFYIESGLVKAYDITKYGEENLLIIRKEKEVFPLIWAITRKDRDIIYQAMSPVVVWRISQSAMQEYLDDSKNPVRPLLDMVTEMYRIHSERIINLEYRTVRERLISFLITMSGRFGKKSGERILIDVQLKHQDIASSINATRETTNRELSKLIQAGHLKTASSKITILDIKRFRGLL